MAVPCKQHLTDSENGKLRRGSEPPPFKLAVDDAHMASSSVAGKALGDPVCDAGNGGHDSMGSRIRLVAGA